MNTSTSCLRGRKVLRLHGGVALLLVTIFLSSGGFSAGTTYAWNATTPQIRLITSGGPSDDAANSVAVDAQGNTYVSGFFQSTVDFDPGPGTFNGLSAGFKDIFISKFNIDGELLWSKQFGSSGYDDVSTSLAVDSLGNVVFSGYFGGTIDFDPGVATFNLTSTAGSTDIFVAKLSSTGLFAWAKKMGGSNLDESESVKIAPDGGVVTTGFFAGTADFDPGASTSNLVASGGNDIFVSKLDSSGQFIWARKFGGSQYEYGKSISVDTNGNVVTVGHFDGSVDFDPGVGSTVLTSVSGNDVFVSKLDSSGAFVWAKSMGSTDWEAAYAVAIDANGGTFVGGYFNGTVDFDPGASAYSLTSNAQDAFVLKLDADGNFLWARAIGGSYSEVINTVEIDSGNRVHVGGLFQSLVDFDPGIGVTSRNTEGFSDGFIATFDTSGTFLRVGTFGSSLVDVVNDIATDVQGNKYIVGAFSSTVDFDPESSTVTASSNGLLDLFFTVLDVNGSALASTTSTSTSVSTSSSSPSTTFTVASPTSSVQTSTTTIASVSSVGSTPTTGPSTSSTGVSSPGLVIVSKAEAPSTSSVTTVAVDENVDDSSTASEGVFESSSSQAGEKLDTVNSQLSGSTSSSQRIVVWSIVVMVLAIAIFVVALKLKKRH